MLTHRPRELPVPTFASLGECVAQHRLELAVGHLELVRLDVDERHVRVRGRGEGRVSQPKRSAPLRAARAVVKGCTDQASHKSELGLVRLGLTDAQKAALVAFLKTLTDPSFVTDPRFSDPFR